MRETDFDARYGMRALAVSDDAEAMHGLAEIWKGLTMIAAKRLEADTEDSAADKSRPRRMLNEKQVLDIVPLSRTSIYRLEKVGKFPRSTYISANRRVWFADEIIAWQNAVDEFDPNRGRGKGRRRVRAVTASGGKADTR
jgi:predicted DNA-binding transcriptional regulator AlpA